MKIQAKLLVEVSKMICECGCELVLVITKGLPNGKEFELWECVECGEEVRKIKDPE